MEKISKTKFKDKLEKGEFTITSDFLPITLPDNLPGTLLNKALIDKKLNFLKKHSDAICVSDNPFGPGLSSLAAAIYLKNNNIEPIYQISTRDRNQIAICSDLISANFFEINNALCISGYHQTGRDRACPVSTAANVYDIDPVQVLSMIKNLNEESILLDGTKFKGKFSMFCGSICNPFLKPMELNLIDLNKKIKAGANFIYTTPIFDIKEFSLWIDEIYNESLSIQSSQTAIIASVLPLQSLDEAKNLKNKYSNYNITDDEIKRLKHAGKKKENQEGIKIARELIEQIRTMKGVKGIHIASGGKEEVVPELIIGI